MARIINIDLKDIECRVETPGWGSDEARFRFVAMRVASPNEGNYRRVTSASNSFDSNDPPWIPTPISTLYSGPADGEIAFWILGVEEDSEELSTQLLERFENNTFVYDEEPGEADKRWARWFWSFAGWGFAVSLFLSLIDVRAGLVGLAVAFIVSLIAGFLARARGPDLIAYCGLRLNADLLDEFFRKLEMDNSYDAIPFSDYCEVREEHPAFFISVATETYSGASGPGIEASLTFTTRELPVKSSYTVRFRYRSFEE